MKTFMLLFLAGICQAIEPARQPHPPIGGGDKLLTYNETVPRAKISPATISVDWISTDEDGQYLYQDEDSTLVIQSIITETKKTLIKADQVPDDAHEYFLKPDLSAVMWATNYTKQYRHSYFSNYFIQDVKTGELTPLAEDQAGDLQYAAWGPVGNTIAYVRGNNLFIRKDGTTTQITTDGGPDTFNGVPDWVYEEEIFGDRYAFWFSPDGKSLAFLRFDETGVPTFTIPYYMNNKKVAPPYPKELDLRYPKVSETNPTVEFHLLDMSSLKSKKVPTDAFPADELIIGEVAWVTEKHQEVVFRAFNRVQDQEKIVLVDTGSGKASVVRERDGTDGWLDNLMSIQYVGNVKNDKTQGHGDTYYVDISDESGWAHIYLFPVKGGKPIALTSGEWEVTGIVSIDTERELIYYLSTKHHPTERHLYSVSYSTLKTKALVDDTVAAYWSASFSSKGGYYILTYRGPDVPYQELYSIDSPKPLRVITSNEEIVNKLKEYKLPKITFFDIPIESGDTLAVMQRLPANFDPRKKYPVLFTPYGGPGAQEVSKAWKALNWKAYIASDPELEFITWTVDNRGTGFKGRKFRATVAKQLGLLEAEDQIAAARSLGKKCFVDKDRMGIWGWSYGGYLSSKVLETDSGIFSFGMITAPVSDFRLYDSMYTERYMKTYEQNEAGYNATAVRKPEGFKNVAGSFLVQHGTGDDNVHFQHAAALIDLLMGAGVPPQKMATQWFTDSDHSIRYNGGSEFLYKQLTRMLYKEKTRDVTKGPEGHQWSRRGREGPSV
ncbi:dipeptidyl peptidase 4 [Blastomyces gilchristii SLH14081]|uniref:dipeptidyl-peptidase IV n=1 Tax=Blastomyces gilchristii (strain SLH14081) TaxID=559298 RepID=A0A179UMP4_BLAGS|nr:dipeptidyl peptidase 4 [Blastomyces gilchristii SLH14081]OAT09150.1 dipeptidyl peptidase 4 [Blastomyces gilchristii SLH14081]